MRWATILLLILVLSVILEAKKSRSRSREHRRHKSKGSKGRSKSREANKSEWRSGETLDEYCARNPDSLRCLFVETDSEEEEEEEESRTASEEFERYCRRFPDSLRCQLGTTESPSEEEFAAYCRRFPESQPCQQQSEEDSDEKIPPRETRPPPLSLTTQQKGELKKTCEQSGTCKTQSPQTQAKRAVLFDHVVEAYNAAGQQNVEESVTKILGKIFDAKKAMIEKEGLQDDIDPKDDGTWAGDMLLTEAQADMIIGALKDGRRKKRYSLHLETRLASMWDLPIKYMIDFDFTPEETDVVHQALGDIQSKSCIRFEENTGFIEGPHMAFRKSNDPAFCGLSNLGRVDPFNIVWLNFDCGETINGTTVHEVLHALGVDHQQVRYDRNSHLIIDWANIDPQSYDLFAGDSDRFTSYGIPYDYFSVMHYPTWVAAIDEDKPTLSAAKEPREFYNKAIGQRLGLSDRDAELVRKMYCMPDCEDKNVFCGWWSTSGYCEKHLKMMAELCRKSCDFCPGAAVKPEAIAALQTPDQEVSDEDSESAAEEISPEDQD